jgi:hypothetical protein
MLTEKEALKVYASVVLLLDIDIPEANMKVLLYIVEDPLMNANKDWYVIVQSYNLECFQ